MVQDREMQCRHCGVSNWVDCPNCAELEAEVERLRDVERFWQSFSILVEDAYPTQYDRWMEKARGIATDTEAGGE